MSQIIVSNVKLEIDNEGIAYYGNSVSIDPGLLDVNVVGLSAGGGEVETGHGEDITTGVSMVKFKIPSNGRTIDRVAKWKANPSRHVVKVYGGDIDEVMQHGSCAEAREITLDSAEGGIEVTFKGDPMRKV